MIIDFHTHTFPDKIAKAAIAALSAKSHTKPFTDGTNALLRASMQQAGIGASLILPVATSSGQVEHINDRAAAVNAAGMRLLKQETGEECEPVLLSLGCMHPDYENYRDELKRIKEMGLKGIKIHPVYQGTDIDDIRFLRIFDCCAQLGLAVVTHAGLDIGFPGMTNSTATKCRKAAKAVDTLTFILAHMGGWEEWEEVPQLLTDTNVYLDTSFSTGRICPLDDGYWENGLEMMDEAAFMRLYEAFGAKRLLFGTDCPWSSQKETLSFMRALPIPQEALALILGENAQRILGLDHCSSSRSE